MIEEEQQEDPTKAAENLTIEMAAEDENQSRFEIPEPTEEVVEDVGTPQELDEVIEEIEATPNEHIHLDNSLSDSIKILQEHGITMLPNDDDNNILSTVMESGHSVVLTDVGKQVLDSVKASEEASDITKNLGKSNYITLTADEFLSLAANTSINKNQAQIFRQVNGKFVPKIIKRIVMKKNKLQTISPVPNILKQKSPSHHNQSIQVNQLKQNTATGTTNELEVVMKQLVEAKKTIEEYKLKLMQKEAEAERYKEQLNILMGCS
ncbi:hypothetical protein HHI36_024361 [Cryptolaemus montrouzieri]|uniref:Uncharacterized protein n=1 Tax=Cryptolaemus montrouzieri TaxID=559131 RepID=A0ABD2MWA5_9CUCU